MTSSYYEKNGWIYVSIKGKPYERGFQYGSYVAKHMKNIFDMVKFSAMEDYGQDWDYFIDLGKKYLKHTIKTQYYEFYKEMEGFADGCTKEGTITNIDEIIAWNNIITIAENLLNFNGNSESLNKSKISSEGGSTATVHNFLKTLSGSSDRCSAFMACGDYTTNGQIVTAHNNFSNFLDGQYANVVIDIYPDKGHRFIMQGFIGCIWSGTDFFVTENGFIGTETTIGGFLPYENKAPISCRIRQCMQYANSLDDYVDILTTNNSGDYANSWIIGDINSNEIMLIELGLKYVNVQKKTNGYFIGFNATYDPRIRHLECVNTGYDDIRRHQGARRVRLTDLMEENKGNIDVELAKQLIADHYDVYLKEINPCSRTVCSHYELDAREYMSQSDRPKPFQPRGALDGCVTDSYMAKKMEFSLRWGCSCGTPFIVNEFCNKNKQWKYLEEYLHDRPSQPWTNFTITNTLNMKTIPKIQIHNVTGKRNKHKSKTNTIKKH